MAGRRDSTSSSGSGIHSPGTNPTNSDLDALSDLGSDFELVSEDDTDDAHSNVSHTLATEDNMSLSYPDPSIEEGTVYESGLGDSLSGSSIFRSSIRSKPLVLEPKTMAPPAENESATATPLAQSLDEPPTVIPSRQTSLAFTVEDAEAKSKAIEENEQMTEINHIAKSLDALSARSPSFWLGILRQYKPTPGMMGPLIYGALVIALVSSGVGYLTSSSASSPALIAVSETPLHTASAPTPLLTISTAIASTATSMVAATQSNSLSLFGSSSRALAIKRPACGRLRSCDVALIPSNTEKSLTTHPTLFGERTRALVPWTSTSQYRAPEFNLSSQAAWSAAVEALNMAAEAWSTAHLRVAEAVKRANLTEQSRRLAKRSQRYFALAHRDSKRLLHDSKLLWNKVNQDWETRSGQIEEIREAWLGKDGKSRKRILERARHGARKMLDRKEMRTPVDRVKRRDVKGYNKIVQLSDEVAKHKARSRRAHSRRH